MNNALSIVNNYKRLYRKTKNAYWARKIERITGNYPDGLVSTGYDQEDFQNNTNNELELLDFTNPNQIF